MTLFLAASFPFFVMPLAFVLINYSYFWFAIVNTSHRDYLHELSKGKIHLLLLRAMALSYLAIVLVMLLFPLGFLRKLRIPTSLDIGCATPPVVLVHGLWHNPSGWLLFRHHLKKAGFANLFSLGYNSWKCSFEDALNALNGLISKVSELCPGQPVILIGHSLGGLLCRAFADKAGSEKKVLAVVTLGAPHQGSQLAAMAMGKLARSLAYRGALIRELEKAAPSGKIHRLAIFSPIDTMVLPYSALRVNHNAWTHYESAPVSHLAMVFDPGTAKYVVDYLKKICLAQKEARQTEAVV